MKHEWVKKSTGHDEKHSCKILFKENTCLYVYPYAFDTSFVIRCINAKAALATGTTPMAQPTEPVFIRRGTVERRSSRLHLRRQVCLVFLLKCISPIPGATYLLVAYHFSSSILFSNSFPS